MVDKLGLQMPCFVLFCFKMLETSLMRSSVYTVYVQLKIKVSFFFKMRDSSLTPTKKSRLWIRVSSKTKMNEVYQFCEVLLLELKKNHVHNNTEGSKISVGVYTIRSLRSGLLNYL